jgi:hypothetical protein
LGILYRSIQWREPLLERTHTTTTRIHVFLKVRYVSSIANTSHVLKLQKRNATLLARIHTTTTRIHGSSRVGSEYAATNTSFTSADLSKEKRDGAGEDPYNYYKNPRIFEGML